MKEGETKMDDRRRKGRQRLSCNSGNALEGQVWMEGRSGEGEWTRRNIYEAK